ncbi:MAG: UDP-glucose 4-epimerase GalE [Bacteroidota bacterium]|nr:UDP-glucose 4-epimerase GalE [Bacteroidota bacterium]
MNRVLVTGGAGYIGSHTVVELMNKDYDVVVVDNLSNSSEKSLDGIEKITGKKPDFRKVELCNFDEVQSVFNEFNDIVAVIHFAACKAVGESIEKPLMYYKNNVFSMINLMQAISEYKNEISLVFSSSCSVYGKPDELPVKESFPFNKSQSPYGETKQLSEQIIVDTLKKHQHINAISLRYFNPIGAHESGFIGEAPKITNNLIPILTETATGKRKEMYVFGNDYQTPDGTAVRDYIHVVDLAKAHLVALSRLVNKKNKSNHEAYNVGLGKAYSVLEIIKTFEKVSERKMNYKIVERREGDIAEIFADSSLIKKELGWKAEYDLDEMLKSAWLWESKYRNY